MLENENTGRGKSGKVKYIAAAILILVLAGGAYYYLGVYRPGQNPEVKAKKEQAELTGQISNHLMLPTDDEPVIYNIEDPELLKGQQKFFENSNKGDKLIVYPKTGKAVIYSPERDIVVNVGPVTFDQNTGANGEQASPVGTTPSTNKAK
jgi:hypothetical protein